MPDNHSLHTTALRFARKLFLCLPLGLLSCGENDAIMSQTHSEGQSFRILNTKKCPENAQKWFRMAYRSATDGFIIGRDQLTRAYAGVCAEQNRPVDHTSFQRGTKAGLKTYCTPEGAYWLGRGRFLSSSGKGIITDYCPASMATELRDANEAGNSYRVLEKQIEDFWWEHTDSVSGTRTASYLLHWKERWFISDLESNLENLPVYEKPTDPF